jgi:hypothetical protein
MLCYEALNLSFETPPSKAQSIPTVRTGIAPLAADSAVVGISVLFRLGRLEKLASRNSRRRMTYFKRAVVAKKAIGDRRGEAARRAAFVKLYTT